MMKCALRNAIETKYIHLIIMIWRCINPFPKVENRLDRSF